jgi:signal transduction histidine kinase
MKILPKLTLALLAGTCAILAVNGYLRVERERGYFDADRVRDHEMIARSLAAATSAVWRSEGEEAARRAIEAVASRFTAIQIRLVEPSDLWSDFSPPTLASLPSNQPITRVFRARPGGPVWETVVLLDGGGPVRKAIEISEPMDSEARFVRSAIIDTATTALAFAVVSAALSFLMGQWVVGARVRALSAKARRIGLGDFSGPVVVGQSDELTDLAREINAMCDRLSTTLQQLRHADRLATVGKLASGIAHELGTPLNVVHARAKMIVDGEATGDLVREYATVIVTATDRMTKTIRQLLQFARRSPAEKERRDLVALTREVIELLRPLADKRNVVLELRSDLADASVQADGGQIHQVVTNLAMNAIQATPKGGLVDLTVSQEMAAAPVELGGSETLTLCLRVRDRGVGIAPEHLPNVFEPFFTTKDVGEGTGLGLAVAYGIIREHGGWIAVESELGSGSTFSIHLPSHP